MPALGPLGGKSIMLEQVSQRFVPKKPSRGGYGGLGQGLLEATPGIEPGYTVLQTVA
jgi:hypothetical protein